MRIGFYLFDGVTQLDFTGPAQFLSRLPDTKVDVLAQSMTPIKTDCGFAIVPTATFDQAGDFDLICVPGGFGVADALTDGAVVGAVARAAEHAQWTTSVCTGAFVLGAAGLLDGKKATTHWAYGQLLERYGASWTKARVVTDGSLITGGGVTAGIDFALTVAAEVVDIAYAQRLQLQLEYNPAPPTAAGSPTCAPAALVAEMSRWYKPSVSSMETAIQRSLIAP